MSKMLAALAAFAVTLAGTCLSAQAQFHDPSAHGVIRLEPLRLGVDNEQARMEPTEYRLKVGQGYRLKIIASDLTEYAFVAPEFVRNVWVRKLEVGDPEVEIKTVTFDEIEFENGGEAEVFFVPIRPGTYDFGPKGLMERGMVGKIIVESAEGGFGPKPRAKRTKKKDDDD